MNYLITGGTGLIGRQLVTQLLNRGDNVIVLSRAKKDSAIGKTDTLSYITKLTLNDIECCDVIINLAGEPIADKRWSAQQKTEVCQSRWHITQKITELIQESKKPPKLFISGSAIGVYGRQNNQVINEDFNQFHHEFTHTVCKKWEDIALTASSDQTRVAVLRTGIVLSENGGALKKMLLPFKLGVGGKIASGQQIMSWIHLDDMVKAILHVVDTNSLHGAINLTSPNAVSNNDFSHLLAKTLHRPSLLTTPATVLKLIFGEMADLLLFGQNVYPNKLLASGYQFQYPKLANALESLLK